MIKKNEKDVSRMNTISPYVDATVFAEMWISGGGIKFGGKSHRPKSSQF